MLVIRKSLAAFPYGLSLPTMTAAIALLFTPLSASFAARNSDTDLMVAIGKNLPQMAKTLLQEGVVDVFATNQEGKNALMMAAERGHNEIVSMIQRAGENIHKKNPLGETAIFLAAKNGQLSTLKLLRRMGGNLEDKNLAQETLLIAAVKNGHESVVEFLMEQEVDLEEVDAEGATALMWASYMGYKEMAELLLENGAEIEPKQSQSNALMWSILGRQKNVFAMLARELWGSAIDPNYRNKSGSTMLMSAAMAKDVNMVKFLIGKGCNVNAVNHLGETALMLVAAPQYRWMKTNLPSSDAVMVARALLREDAKINVQTSFGETALSYAMVSGNRDLVKELLGSHADPNIPDDHYTTPLMDVLFDAKLDIGRLLIDKGASFKNRDRMNRSPLMYAILGGSPRAVEFALQDKSSIEEVEDGFGWTPLILAANLGHVEIVRILLRNGADPNGLGKQGETALMRASFVNNKLVAELLLDSGADIGIADQSNKTALLWATEGGCLDIVKLLLSQGANPFSIDAQRNDAIDIAMSRGLVAIANEIEAKQDLLLERLSDSDLQRLYGVWRDFGSTPSYQNQASVATKGGRTIDGKTVRWQTNAPTKKSSPNKVGLNGAGLHRQAPFYGNASPYKWEEKRRLANNRNAASATPNIIHSRSAADLNQDSPNYDLPQEAPSGRF